MFCEECGAKLEEGALFCSNCGKAVKRQYVEELKAGWEADRPEYGRSAETICEEAGRKVKRNRKIIMIGVPVVCVMIAFILILKTVSFPGAKKQRIETALAAYEKAIDAKRTEYSEFDSGHGKFVGASLVNIDDDGIPECIAWFDGYYCLYTGVKTLAL